MKDKAAGLTSASTPTVLLRSLGRPSNSRCSHPFDASGTLSGLGRGETLPPPLGLKSGLPPPCAPLPPRILCWRAWAESSGAGAKPKSGKKKKQQKKWGLGGENPEISPKSAPQPRSFLGG